MKLLNSNESHTRRNTISTKISCPGYTIELTQKGVCPNSAFKLRADVFCRELKWVGHPSHMFEQDQFDEHVFHICLWVGNTVAGYLRIHPRFAPWMIEDVFQDHVPETVQLRNHGECEVSRLAVHPKYRKHSLPDGSNTVATLYRALHVFCNLHRFHTCWMIITRRVLYSLKANGLPCEVFNACDLNSLDPKNDPVLSRLIWDKLEAAGEPFNGFNVI